MCSWTVQSTLPSHLGIHMQVGWLSFNADEEWNGKEEREVRKTMIGHNHTETLSAKSIEVHQNI